MILAMAYDEQPKDYTDSLNIANYFFTGVFIFEALLKIFVYGPYKYI